MKIFQLQEHYIYYMCQKVYKKKIKIHLHEKETISSAETPRDQL